MQTQVLIESVEDTDLFMTGADIRRLFRVVVELKEDATLKDKPEVRRFREALIQYLLS